MKVLEDSVGFRPTLQPATVATTRGAGQVVGAALGLAAGFGGLYFSTLAIFLKPIAGTFGWGRADASAVAVMALFGSAIGGPFLGRLMDRAGARRVIGGSALLFAAMMFVLSVLPGNHVLFAACSLILGFVAVGTGPAGYLSVLPEIFDRRLGLALSLAMMGLGVGAAIFPTLTQTMVSLFGWRQAYQGLAVIALLVGIAAYLLMTSGQPRKRVATAGSAAFGDTLPQALRDRRFWILNAAIFIGTGAGLGATVHLVALLTDRGISPLTAAALFTFSSVGLILGRLLAGILMDIVFAPLVAAGGFILGAVGLTLIGLNLTAAFPVLAFSTLLFGFALGAEGDFAAFAVRRYFGTKSFGVVYGSTYAAYALGGVVGPILFGIGFDRLGGYGLVLALAAIGYVVSAIAVLTLGRYRWAPASLTRDNQQVVVDA